MKRTSRVGTKREPVIDPVLERPLLGLHRAMNIDSFWKAVQRLLSAAIPNRLMGMTLQHIPILPMITRWTLPMPDGFFNAAPLKGYIAGRPRNRFVRISDVFANRSSLMKSAFYRRYMAPQRCLHGVGLFFLARPEAHLRDCNHAHGNAGRSLIGGNEIAPAALSAGSDRASPARIARARTLGANGF
jgi:hypothetical protein